MSTSKTLSNLHREWSENYKLACWIIHRRLRQKLGRYEDELVQEALGKVEAETKKPEFFQATAASAQQTAGQ